MAYRSNYRSTSIRGGFTKTNGTVVSSARAHQRTGQTFGGYTKTRTSAGGFKMVKGR